MIPADKTYYQQLKKYENELAKADINKAHGLRHAYAQKRYFDLTSWQCPAKGGTSQNTLTKEQQYLDRQARELISLDLGHERIDVVAIYCGK